MLRIHDFPRSRSRRVKRQLRSAYDRLVDHGHDAVDMTRDRVEEHPMALVIGALVFGVLFGRFTFRD